MQKVMLRWQAGTLSGWGILGLNLFERWASDPDIQPLMGVPLALGDFPGTSPLRFVTMQNEMNRSNRFIQALQTGEIDLREQAVSVIDGFGDNLTPFAPQPTQMGIRNIARCIFEQQRLSSVQPIDPYDSVLCASNWAAEFLQSVTRKPVTMILEGIDHSLFFPGPRSGIMDPDCFYVFSGGKIEFRKAQDLVIAAFREFSARHEDAVLVTAWNSPWPPEWSIGLQGCLSTPLRQGHNGQLLIREWVEANGVKPHQFIELPLTANSLMPAVLREMDCALQVSRSEACTNLPAMEAMACGVPVILPNNTGMRDLIATDNCIPLNLQKTVIGPSKVSTIGWGESQVDEIVAALELMYTDSERRKRIGARGAKWIVEHRRTWRDHAADLKAFVQSVA